MNEVSLEEGFTNLVSLEDIPFLFTAGVKQELSGVAVREIVVSLAAIRNTFTGFPEEFFHLVVTRQVQIVADASIERAAILTFAQETGLVVEREGGDFDVPGYVAKNVERITYGSK